MDEVGSSIRDTFKFSSHTFEQIAYIHPNELIREVFGIVSFTKTRISDVKTLCIDFKKKHISLLENIESWQKKLMETSKHWSIIDSAKYFLEETMNHFLGGGDSFLHISRAQTESITDYIIYCFDPESVKNVSYNNIDFECPTPQLHPVSVLAQKKFLFQYLVGWMGLFFDIAKNKAELKYIENNSLADCNPLREEDGTSLYLSKLVRNPTLTEIRKYVKGRSYDLLELVFEGDVRKIAKKCVGNKVMKQLNYETVLIIFKYLEELSTITQLRITNEISNRTLSNLLDLSLSIFSLGVHKDLYPLDNITNCSRKIEACFEQSYQPNETSRLLETLEPCSDPVSVEFIDFLAKMGFSLDLQRAVYYNSMYFFIMFSLQVVRLYSVFSYKCKRITFRPLKSRSTVKIIDALHRRSQKGSSIRDRHGSATTERGTDTDQGETAGHDLKKKKKKTKKHSKQEVSESASDEPTVTEEKVIKNGSDIDMEVEEYEDDEDVLIISPVKKPSLCVTLDSDIEVYQ